MMPMYEEMREITENRKRRRRGKNKIKSVASTNVLGRKGILGYLFYDLKKSDEGNKNKINLKSPVELCAIFFLFIRTINIDYCC